MTISRSRSSSTTRWLRHSKTGGSSKFQIYAAADTTTTTGTTSADSAFGSAPDEWADEPAPSQINTRSLPRAQKLSVTISSHLPRRNDTFASMPRRAALHAAPTTQHRQPLERTPFNMDDKQTWLSRSAHNGFVRVFDSASGDRSSLLVPCSLSTTVVDIAAKLGCPPNALHITYSDWTSRPLSWHEQPLQLQDDYLLTTGMRKTAMRQDVGDLHSLSACIRFYTDIRTPAQSALVRSGYCNVRRAGVLARWQRRLCLLQPHQLLVHQHVSMKIKNRSMGDLYKMSVSAPAASPPTVVPLTHAHVSMVECANKGGKAVRIVYTLAKKKHALVFSADTATATMDWHQMCASTSQSLRSTCDLSGQHLTALPSHVTQSAGQRLVTAMSLRRNCLSDDHRLEGIAALQSLRSLNLAQNGIYDIPGSVIQLPALTHLVLATNRLTTLPAALCRMENLRSLDVSNNHICELPPSLVECVQLTQIDLSFNHLTSIPAVLAHMPHVVEWSLAGNLILDDQDTKYATLQRRTPHYATPVRRTNSTSRSGTMSPKNNARHARSTPHVGRVDVRRNKLTSLHFLLNQSSVCRSVTHLDISDNELHRVDARGLPCLQMVNAERCALTELALGGRELVSVVARNNKLTTIDIWPPAHKLKQLDYAHNRVRELPPWLAECAVLQRLVVSNNSLRSLPEHLLDGCSDLQVLSAHHNSLDCMPSTIGESAVDTLLLHHNRLTVLPLDMFAHMPRLRVLNVAQNMLQYLPPVVHALKLQKLVASANWLDDSIWPTITSMTRLRTLDLAYNRLRQMAPLVGLDSLQYLNVAANRFSTLPDGVCELSQLHTIVAHSNLLVALPQRLLSASSPLRTLDVANNQLESISLPSTEPIARRLDVSCNARLRLPQIMPQVAITKLDEIVDDEGNWGYADSSGERDRLCVRRLSTNVPKGRCVALVDGGLNADLPNVCVDIMPPLIQAEATKVDANVQHEHLSNALLRTHVALGEIGQKMGASCALLQLIRLPDGRQRVNLANVGNVEVVLGRAGAPLVLSAKHTLGGDQPGSSREYDRIRHADATVSKHDELNDVTTCTRQLGCTFEHPAVVAEPHALHFDLSPTDELLIMATAGLWSVMSHTEAIRRARSIANALLAAKHLRDMALSYGHADSVGVCVVRLGDPARHAPPKLPRVRTSGELRYAMSASHINRMHEEDDDEVAVDDDDAVSEARGLTLDRTPVNYYFEYKRRLKEMCRQEDDSDTQSMRSDDTFC